MPERNIHSEAVKAWRAGWPDDMSRAELLDVLERALDGLWRRAHVSLGEISLRAIVDRVLHHGTERHPHLAALQVGPTGVHVEEAKPELQGVDPARLEESVLFLVTELLRVLGTLTGEILTPGLHAELHKVQIRTGEHLKGGKA